MRPMLIPPDDTNREQEKQTMSQSIWWVGGISLLATLFSMPAQAQGGSGDKDWSLTVGAGVFGATSLYKGDDNDIGAFPYLSLTWGRLTVSLLDGVEYTLVDTDTYTFGVNLGVRGSPDYPKGALFDGLKRDDAFEIGFDATADFGEFYAAADVSADVSSEHDGYEIGLDVGKEFQVGEVTVDLSLGARYQDSKLSQYEYGVAQSEVTAARSRYAPGGVVIPHIEVAVTRQLNKSVTLGGFAGYEFLPSDVSDSPLVDASGVGSVGLFVMKTF